MFFKVYLTSPESFLRRSIFKKKLKTVTPLLQVLTLRPVIAKYARKHVTPEYIEHTKYTIREKYNKK